MKNEATNLNRTELNLTQNSICILAWKYGIRKREE
jgi:hypothetical protein